MKSKFFLPALTAIIGFAAAWIAKPVSSAAPAAVVGEAAPRDRAPRLDTRPSPLDNKRPKEVKAGDFPLADQADLGPKTRDEAKMLRLSEALGLSIDQEGGIIKAIEDAQAAANGDLPVIEDLAARGKIVEETLAKILTPEQFAKFQELRVRERENRVEFRAQRLLVPAIEQIDLSPEQREEVLNRLRQKSKAEMQSIPASATLLFDKSMLPTGGKELTVDGVLMLAKMGVAPSSDPLEAQRRVTESHRRELEEILACFDGILTPGQMGQYQAALHEQREILKRVPPIPEEALPEP